MQRRYVNPYAWFFLLCVVMPSFLPRFQLVDWSVTFVLLSACLFLVLLELVLLGVFDVFHDTSDVHVDRGVSILKGQSNEKAPNLCISAFVFKLYKVCWLFAGEHCGSPQIPTSTAASAFTARKMKSQKAYWNLLNPAASQTFNKEVVLSQCCVILRS